MDFVERLQQRFSTPRPDLATLLKLTPLDARVQKHLSKVYAQLLLTFLALSAGAGLGSYAPSQGLLGLGQVGAFGCLLALGFMQANYSNQGKRSAILYGFGFCQGLALSPLVLLAAAINPSIIMTALLATGAIFGCFSVASLMTPRRTYLFLGGYLASAIMGFMVLRLVGWFSPSMRAFGYSVELYLGLLVFSGYVLFDTQMIVEKAAAGHMDSVDHALTLFVDLVAILVRVAVILIDKERKKAAEEERRRKQRRD